MLTRTRLILLLGTVVATFLVGTGMLHRSHRTEAEAMLQVLQTERAILLARTVELTGQSLNNFARDYSLWDEMAAYVDQPDPAWAKVNISASLPNFGSHAAWVLRRDGRAVFHTSRAPAGASPEPPLPRAELVARLEEDRFLHFSVWTAEGLLEIRTAPIQPSADTERASRPLGWLVVGRLWNDEHVHSLQRLLGGNLRLHAPHTGADPDHAAPGVHLDLPLVNWAGQPVASLHSYYFPAPFALLQQENHTEMILFVASSLVVLALLLGGISRWVLLPLARLEESLARGSPEPLARLRPDGGEFGRLARLVAASFSHRSALEAEIEERRRAEAALRSSESSLREAAALRVRLGRDLHDGVIQSIFAAGLGLEGVRESMRRDPAAAEARLNAIRTSLNHTIREVRSFITGLEPEEPDRPPFVQNLRALVQTLQIMHPGSLELELAEGDPPGRPAAEEVHALQIVRESVSNALRHGEAKHIRITYGAAGGRAQLVVADDGRGFDPAQVARQGDGSGLANLAARAREMGAVLEIVSAPGAGTRIILTFAPTGPGA